SIPSLTGSYTNINAKLTLISNRYRKSSQVGDNYVYNGIDDARFSHNIAGLQSIATSSAQNDAGLFELNFQDERYLPFEGAGAISSWRLELSNDYRQFDYDTISDVIIHLNYTAREGGQQLKVKANESIKQSLKNYTDILASSEEGLIKVLSLKTHFPNKLYQLLQPINGELFQETSILLKKEHFPFIFADKSLSIAGSTSVLVKYKEENTLYTDLKVTVKDVDLGVFQNAAGAYPLPFVTGDVGGSLLEEWPVKVENSNTGEDLTSILNSELVEDILIIVNYTID
ncbi:hypothetical protein C9994_14855, partial [Marivirga lumbricoides]